MPHLSCGTDLFCFFRFFDFFSNCDIDLINSMPAERMLLSNSCSQIYPQQSHYLCQLSPYKTNRNHKISK